MQLKPGQKQPIIVIVGPTASGKSDLAVILAKHFGGEVISADSRQVYRGLDIGSGKITKNEMQGVRHHLIDAASPKRTYTVSRFVRDGKRAIAKIHKNGKLPIIVGGTGFYIDALVYDLKFPDAKPDHTLRKSLAKMSTDQLFETLNNLDSERAETIDRHNHVRLIRSIEIAKQFGKIKPLKTNSPYHPIWIGLNCEREHLKNRIAIRLEKRIGQGMLKEFADLHAGGLSYKRMFSLGLEYRFGARLIKQEISRGEFTSLLNAEINKYAKRQMTWFKRNKSIQWFNIDTPVSEVVSYVQKLVECN